ncbi:M56 family metallopeptidase [Reichenbachiella sp.]|uniref:M56 family metallopeptidase n=1 Tax=Reichenbachiella sp. TaxID=2184521 RepID=UPI003B5B616C
MINSIPNYLFESSIALGVFSLFYLIALQREKSFKFNRFYLLGSVGLSLIIPLISFSFESLPSSFVAGTIFLDPVAMGANSTSQGLNFLSYLPWIYISASTILLAKLIGRTTTLLLNRHQSQKKDQLRLRIVTDSAEAYTFLDTVFLGSQLSTDEQNVILSHEKVHAKEWHSLDILFFELITALLWINPFVYIIKKLARINHEYLADAQAIQNANRESYIQTLAAHTIRSQGYELAHTFHTSSTLNRIKMINQQNNQTMKIKQIIPFVLALGLVLTFGCEDAVEQLSEMNDPEAAKAIAQVQTSTVKKAEGLEGVYDQVEVLPDPSGGMTEFYQWVAEHMEYPTQARKEGIEGKVFIQFIVDETGQLTEVKSIKGIGAGCDAEAVRVMKSAAKWAPGQVDGKPVKVRMILPVTFKLS